MRAGVIQGPRGFVSVLGILALAVAACAGPGAPSSAPTASATIAPTPTTGSSPSIAPGPSVGPTTGPSSTASIGAAIVKGSIAKVTVDRLNLRASASESSAIRATLTAGTRLFVIGEPKVVGKLRWHDIAVINPTNCVSDDCYRIGWVATPASGTEAWITDAPIQCPPSPTTAEDLSALLPLEQLHCYAGRELIVTGWVETPCCGYVGPLTFSPEWLASGPPAFFRLRTGERNVALPFAIDPASTVELPDTTVIIRATAHFDDPAASTCAASIAADAGEEGLGVTPPSRAAMVLFCRVRLVISSYDVVGYLSDGAGCGCLPPSPEPVG
jgi:hypothetical protein